MLPSPKCEKIQIQKTDIQTQSAWSDGMKNCWLSPSYREPNPSGPYKSVLHFRSKYNEQREIRQWVNTIKGCSKIPIKFISSRNFQLLFHIYHLMSLLYKNIKYKTSDSNLRKNLMPLAGAYYQSTSCDHFYQLPYSTFNTILSSISVQYEKWYYQWGRVSMEISKICYQL